MYVRKRDPRYLAYQEQQKQKQKQTQAGLKAKIEKEKELLRAKAEKFQEQEWSRVQDGDEENNGSGSDKSGDELDQEYECIICDKFFKSERQWKNHERSKRHLKAVEDIRLEMMHEENELLGLSSAGSMSPLTEQDGKNEEEEQDHGAEQGHTESDYDEDESDEIPAPVPVAPVYSDLLKSKKKNKKKKVMTTGHDFDEAELDEMDQDGLADLLGSVRLSSRASTPGTGSNGGRRSRAGQQKQRDLYEGEGADSDGETPMSTAPASRAESPDGGVTTKKLSAKEKKKARSERAAQKVRNNNENRFSVNILWSDINTIIYLL